MEARKIIFGDYNTSEYGWTLSNWVLAPAVEKTSYVDKLGGDGSWDLSTALTDGTPTFSDRVLTATFERSDGTRLSREAEISYMINNLHGRRVDIHLPDDDTHHLSGRLHVVKEYNDLAHGAVSVSAVCDPWKYADNEKIVPLGTLGPTAKTVVVTNMGYRTVVPVITVTDEGAEVQLTFGTKIRAFSAGDYKWPDLLLLPGRNSISLSGSGTVKLTYREAVLE